MKKWMGSAAFALGLLGLTTVGSAPASALEEYAAFSGSQTPSAILSLNGGAFTTVASFSGRVLYLDSTANGYTALGSRNTYVTSNSYLGFGDGSFQSVVSNGFVGFDLTGFVGTASSATLTLDAGYLSNNPTISFSNYTGDAGTLGREVGFYPNYAPQVAADVANGPKVGSVSFTDADVGKTVSVALNGSFLSRLNAAVASGAATVAVVASAGPTVGGGGGAGAPGPVAGAGLPFVGAAVLAWLGRRRKLARTGITA